MNTTKQELERTLRRIANMPHGRDRYRAVYLSVRMLDERIASYNHFFHWPALIASLEADRDRIKALENPLIQVGHYE